MSYEKTLELAGAEVLASAYFGSYQGDWWALVEYKGELGWARGTFGSCFVCDAFEADFGSETHREGMGNEHMYSPSTSEFVKGCEECAAIKKRMVTFGESYLNDLFTQEEALKEASRNLDWDVEGTAMVEFIKEQWERFAR